VQRRGLGVALADPAVTVDQLESQSLVAIRRFRDLPDALLAKGVLDSAGIECFLADENLVRMDWFYSNLIGGLRLQVRPEDVETANEVLNQPIPGDFVVEGDGEYQQPRCPKCESLEITFEPLYKGIGLASAYFLMFPLPIPKNMWTCQSCGQRWQELPDRDEETDADERIH